MKVINIKIKGIRVTGFYPKEGNVEFLIDFNDGRDQQIHKTVRIQDPRSLANRIILEITNVEKSKKVEFDGESILGGYVNIKFENEAGVKKKMAQFFLDVLTKVENVRKFKEAAGYIDAIGKVRMMRREF